MNFGTYRRIKMHVLRIYIGLIPLLMVSIFGVFALAVSSYLPEEKEHLSWRKEIVGTIFCSICIAGALAAIYPRRCISIVFGTSTNLYESPSSYEGHHPSCERYSGHVIKLREQTLCASCTGLASGAILSTIGMILYVSDIWVINSWDQPLITIGLFCMAIGLYWIRFEGVARFASNFVLVTGTFLFLVGIDASARSLLVDMFAEVLTIILILVRMLLSKLDHARICESCKLTCGLKMYSGFV